MYVTVICFGSLGLPLPMLLFGAVRRRWRQLALAWCIHVALVIGIMMTIGSIQRAGYRDWMYAQVLYPIVNLVAAVGYAGWTIAVLMKKDEGTRGFPVIPEDGR